MAALSATTGSRAAIDLRPARLARLAGRGSAVRVTSMCRLRQTTREQALSVVSVRIMTDTIKTAAPPAHPVRQLLAASVGNAVEWYDWFSYTGAGTGYDCAA